MAFGINIISKYFISSTLSLISILIFDESQEVEISWYCVIYGSAYFISLIVFLGMKRLSCLIFKKNIKISFLGLASYVEIVIFFFMEFKFLHNFPIVQRLASLNRMVFLYLRFFCVNKLLAAKKMQLIIIMMLYVINILIYYFINEKTTKHNNLLSVFIGIISIMLNFFMTNTAKNNGIEFEILKNMEQTFFVVKKGKGNKIIYSQEENFRTYSQKDLAKINNHGITHLNDMFLVERKIYSENDINSIFHSVPVIEKADDFVKFNVEKIISDKNNHENPKLLNMNFKLKLKADPSKIYDLSIRQFLFKKQTYFIFNISQPIIQNQVDDSSRIRDLSSFYSSKILKLKNTINELIPLLDQLGFPNELNENNIDLYELALTNLKFSIIRIENLIYYDLIYNNQIIVKKNKIKLVDFLEEITKMLYPLMTCRKIKFDISIEENLLNFEIETDLSKLRQILLNLLLNAFQFIINNGFIHLNVVLLDQKIKFFIEDSGIGLDSKQIEDLNLIFNEVDEKIYDRSKIFNFLSLYITNSLLKVLYSNQTLKIKTLKNKGTTISFFIDCSNQTGKGSNDIEKMVDFGQNTTESIKLRDNFSKSLKYCSALNINSSSNSVLSQISCPERKIKRNSENLKNINTFTSTKICSSNKLRKISSSLFQEFSQSSSKTIKKTCDCKEILLINYDAFSFLPIKFIFNSLKINYSLAFNAKEAISRLSTNKNCTDIECKGVIIVFINCRSPINESIDSIKEIRKHLDNNSLSSIPLIGTMSTISKEELINCFGVGLKDFIASPITLKSIKKCLIKWTSLIK